MTHVPEPPPIGPQTGKRDAMSDGNGLQDEPGGRGPDVLIIGAGMYVCGRGGDGFGTVLPALCEWLRRGRPLGRVTLAATSRRSAAEAAGRLERLNRMMGTRLRLSVMPGEGEAADPDTYRRALADFDAPGCAIVVVPDHLHHPIAAACLEAGWHTLVVKPLTPSVDEALALVALQQRQGLYGAVEFHKRFDRANLKLKEQLQAGALGTPLYFIVEYSQRRCIPERAFRNWVARTNVFQYLGVHYVDIVHFVTGARPVRAMAIGQHGWLRDQGIDALDAVHASVQWRTEDGDDFWSHLHTNWIDPLCTTAMSDQRIKLIGTQGRYESDQKRRGVQVVSEHGGVEDPNPDFCATYPAGDGRIQYQGYGIRSIHTFLHDVVDLHAGRTTLETLDACRPTFRSSLAATAVVEAVNASLCGEGQWVDIEQTLEGG